MEKTLNELLLELETEHSRAESNEELGRYVMPLAYKLIKRLMEDRIQIVNILAKP